MVRTDVVVALAIVALASCDEPAHELIELEAIVEDGQVVFRWDAGTMSELHVYDCAGRPCSCYPDATLNIAGNAKFMWSTGVGFIDQQPKLNPPLVYGQPLEGDAVPIPLQSGVKYLADVSRLDWRSRRADILLLGCTTFVAP